jgi:ribosomal-protein-alanine N-acetyltransferase
VDPSDRLRGLGRAMLDQSLSKLRSLGLRSWWLMVETTNDPAIQFYESYGFRRMRRTKRYYGAGRDAWRMKFVI